MSGLTVSFFSLLNVCNHFFGIVNVRILYLSYKLDFIYEDIVLFRSIIQSFPEVFV